MGAPGYRFFSHQFIRSIDGQNESSSRIVRSCELDESFLYEVESVGLFALTEKTGGAEQSRHPADLGAGEQKIFKEECKFVMHVYKRPLVTIDYTDVPVLFLQKNNGLRVLRVLRGA